MSGPESDLAGLDILLVDPDRFDRDIIVKMLHNFGTHPPARVGSGAAAEAHLEQHRVDICLCEATLSDMDGADLIEWIRHSDVDAVRSIPVVVLTSGAQLATVAKARDSGANTVVRKPVSPKTLHTHLVWALTVHRPMVEADHYVGPDRRFHELAPPDAGERRTSPAVFTQPARSAPDEAAAAPDDADSATST